MRSTDLVDTEFLVTDALDYGTHVGHLLAQFVFGQFDGFVLAVAGNGALGQTDFNVIGVQCLRCAHFFYSEKWNYRN